eukprot:6175599-Pleurochrysis_carterae.AAC.1
MYKRPHTSSKSAGCKAIREASVRARDRANTHHPARMSPKLPVGTENETLGAAAPAAAGDVTCAAEGYPQYTIGYTGYIARRHT